MKVVNVSVRWNEDKCKCECKELVDKKECGKGFISNPSSCNFECNESCSVGKYLDHKNCKCRKKAVDSLVEKCNKSINETLSENSLNDYKCSSCRPYIVLFVVFLIISVKISSFFYLVLLVLKKKYCKFIYY